MLLHHQFLHHKAMNKYANMKASSRAAGLVN